LQSPFSSILTLHANENSPDDDYRLRHDCELPKLERKSFATPTFSRELTLPQIYRDSEDSEPSRANRIIAYCRRQFERFAHVEVYEDGGDADARTCFELRRLKSNSLPLETHLLRTLPTRPNVLDKGQASYQCHMNEDCHPFITTPSSLEEGNPRLIGPIISTSSLQHEYTG
jgi:hypothetical protein